MQSLSGPLTMDLRFPGQWFQLEAGLHYNWHRHYDPSLGRYTQRDPLGFVDGPSVYGYAGGSSLQSADPRGLEREIQRCGIPKRRPLHQCNSDFPRNLPPKCYQNCAKKEFSRCRPISVVICALVGAFLGLVNGSGCFITITYLCDHATDTRCKYACNCLNNNEDAETP